jgi:CBS domain containing-hemolysin-like protein
LKFFVPARLMRGTLVVLLVVFLVQPLGTGFQGGVALAAISIAIIVGIGQILPALIVRRSPERFLDLLLPPFTAAANVVGPLTALIIGWTGDANRRPVKDDAAHTTHESAVLAEPGAETAGDEKLLRSVVDFGDTLVREVMTPRPDMVAIGAEATYDELRAFFREQEYSRIPVYKENLDNIVGFVFIKDLLRLDAPESGNARLQPDLARFIRPATFVPETKRVAEMLKEFQRKQVQIAIVVDEYGGTAGLVTIEDLLEEIVGEIRDEYDVESETVSEESPGVYVFSGKVSVDEVRDRLGITIEREGFETVGGYLLSHLGRMPYVGEAFEAGELAVEALEVERRRITKVRVRRRTAAAAE